MQEDSENPALNITATTEERNDNATSGSSAHTSALSKVLSTASTSGSSVTTQLNASALLEIISSIVTAANVDTPTNQTANEDKNDHSQLTTVPPIQLQLQLNTQPLSQIDEQVLLKAESKGRGRRSSVNNEKSKQSWHYHLGGVRQRRVPLSPEIKEALEVAYVSRIMSKNFRREGQPEKERIAKITGLEIEKVPKWLSSANVHEWFKNRRKKDKLLATRSKNMNFSRSKRGRKPILPSKLNLSSEKVLMEQVTSPLEVMEGQANSPGLKVMEVSTIVDE